MDSLEIKQLSVATRIGVYEWEQRILQTVLIDIAIPISLKDLGDDALGSVIDYDLLCQKVTALVSSNTFQLIETLANRVASFIKEEYGAALAEERQIRVCVAKPQAVKNAGSVQVTVVR